MQAKRILVNEANLNVGQIVEIGLAVPSSPREEVNFHNVWASFNAEPQDADANMQGTWVLFIRRTGQVTVSFTDVNVNNETQNQFIIACGVFGASNQMPFTKEIHPSTSRTLEAGDNLVLQVVATGITVGLVSTRVMLCAHTTRK